MMDQPVSSLIKQLMGQMVDGSNGWWVKWLDLLAGWWVKWLDPMAGWWVNLLIHQPTVRAILAF